MIFDCLHDFEEIEEKILKGQTLLIAADDKLLEKLPAGRWIGGTTTYFMTELGGVCTDKKIFVTELDAVASNISIKTYDENTIENIYLDAPENGFSFIIMPAGPKCHSVFSMEAFSFKNFAMRPLIGWLPGVHLDETGTDKPKAYNGTIPGIPQQGAVVMHVELPDDKSAEVGMLNMFEQGDGDTVTFPESGFNAKEAYINGVKVDFAKYIFENNLDLRLPLVTDVNGTFVNTSFCRNFGDDGEVMFYSPVFKTLEYKHAKPVANYAEKFTKKLSMGLGVEMVFSCNCILNYIYSGLDRYSRSDLSGPVTFGEIAYHIHNQTVVYLRIIHNQ